MKRQIPNLLSGVRLLAAAMGFLPAAGGAFAALYLFCGLTDVLDGWLARRLHAESEVGARLDSAADACFTAAVLFRLWPLVRAYGWLPWYAATVALVRLSAVLLVKLRFGWFGSAHTWGNKAAGLLLFFWSPIWLLAGKDWLLLPLCFAAGLSALEELALSLTARDWRPDRRSILFP